MKSYFTVFVLLTALLGLPIPALSHGVGWRTPALQAIPLEFVYSTGDAMAYQDVRVFSPNDEKFSWQTGRTDEKGHFAFVPNVAGVWRVVVKDDEGHLVTAEIEVTPDFLTGNHTLAGNSSDTDFQGIELAIRAVLGVSLLFNIAAFVLLRKNKK